MPSLVYEIINLFGSILRLLGVAALGVGIGWVAVDLLRKAEEWPLKLCVFLGLSGLVIAAMVFLPAGALGAFGAGLAVAIFLWGLPKKKKEEEK